ncbi:deubiquitinase OTUD6B [Gadus morhua]|uniref:ubiquitinyl hydrolase 1 n=1 Tax=Gadus morhua TaxID=8049 RepID=A0A8C4Z0H1_GADMO|nr:deubiquitinase OTUD6B [Gadus morhua]
MEEDILGSPEELLAKQHRREKKDLQATIQSMKNTVPKNDKKRRKHLTEDICRLEAELNLKQEEEISQLKATQVVEEAVKVEEVVNGVESLGLDGDQEKADEKLPRPTKAQKRRDKKAAQEKERESRIAEAEVDNLLGARHQEGLKLAQKLSERQLQIKEIASDGHCLYRAIEDQLARRALPGLTMSLKGLRSCTAEHMRGHTDDFIPFLTHPNTGDMYSAEDFEKYCNEVDHTAAWGGQLELRALTEVLKLPIEVIQADALDIKIGEEYDSPPITLVYMRHAYGLGEHYNSVERLKEPATEEDS